MIDFTELGTDFKIALEGCLAEKCVFSCQEGLWRRQNRNLPKKKQCVI